jgi:hypothetical protein
MYSWKRILMAASEDYRRQAALIKTIPFVSSESCFALKRGNSYQSLRPRYAASLGGHRSNISASCRQSKLPCRDQRRDAAHCRPHSQRHSGCSGDFEQTQRRDVHQQHFVEADGVQIKSKSRPFCVAAFTTRSLRRSHRPLRSGLDLQKSRSSVSPTFMQGRSGPRPPAPPRPVRCQRSFGKRRNRRHSLQCLRRLYSQPQPSHG